MTSLGLAASDYARPPRLDGEVRGASVLVLGAGLAGLASPNYLLEIEVTAIRP